jgi:hypothetical protein
VAGRIITVVLAAVVAAVALLLLVARPALGPGPTSSPTGVPSPASPTGVSQPASGGSSPTAPGASAATVVKGPSPSGSTGALARNAELLRILPASVANSPVKRDPDREAAALGDAGLLLNASALAAATVGDNGENIATAILVVRRPEVSMATWFPGYRADFDAAVCEPIGGAGVTSTATIAGREVQVTECKGGATVYHVVLRRGTTILSIFDLGPGQFGRKLLEGLAFDA